METHSNKMLVGFVVALLIAALVAFSLWKSANERSRGRPYDIVGTQSASGLLVGSPVTYLGVPVGRVTSAELDPARLGAVKIRIDITEDDLQITEGTVARLSSDLVFGKALISLEQASRSAPVLLARAGDDAPRIPLASGGMGDVASDPAPTIESIRSTVDRLLVATSPEQQRMLNTRFAEMERSTAELAARGPMLGTDVAFVRQSLRDSAATTANLAQQAYSARRQLGQLSGPATTEIRSSLARARDATTTLNGQLQSAGDATTTLNQRLQSARAPVQAFSQSAVDTSLKVRKVREGVAAVQEPVEQVERGGVGALISGPPTPEYRPKNRR